MQPDDCIRGYQYCVSNFLYLQGAETDKMVLETARLWPPIISISIKKASTIRGKVSLKMGTRYGTDRACRCISGET